MMQFIARFLVLLQVIVIALAVLASTAGATEAAPSIDFSPFRGPAGSVVTIKTSSFTFSSYSANRVAFNGVRATISKYLGKDSMEVIVPDEALTGPISVTTPTVAVTSRYSFEISPYKTPVASSGSAPGPGDRKRLEAYMSGFRLKDSPSSSDRVFYAPVNSVLWVDTKVVDGRVAVHFTDDGSPGCCRRASELFMKGGALNTVDEAQRKYDEANDFFEQTHPDQEIIQLNVEYTIDAAALQQYPVAGRGAEYGLLVVPYKFHPSDQALTGAASIGGYIGYQIANPGVAIAFPIFSAGIGVVPVKNQLTGDTSNAASFTVASGIIISLTKADFFQAGILCGFDWAGKGNHYKYEGKPWIAVSFGTNLTK